MSLRAIEFFSGIGAFSYAARPFHITVEEAFDQGADANSAYAHNFHNRPKVRNLDTIKSSDLPPAEIWWLSPPCKPFTVRGKQLGGLDPRARSFLRLIDCMEEIRPHLLCVENVLGFEHSDVHAHLLSKLRASRYCVREIDLCPTDFSVPMRRPRHFLIASTSDLPQLVRPTAHHRIKPVSDFLSHFSRSDRSCSCSHDRQELSVDSGIVERYGRSFHVVDREDEEACFTCFTSGYGRCLRASGSFILDGGLRHACPEEMLRLFGFGADFQMPQHLSLQRKWHLIGNSVDIRSIDYILQSLQGAAH